MIPVSEPLLGYLEKEYLSQCIDTNWISSEGPMVKRFEEEFSSFCGQKFGVAVANGTAALEVALHSVGVGPGDEVIIPSFTIISCALSVLRLNAIPVLVDCDPLTWNMKESDIEGKITDKTKAIMAVHIYGHPLDMDVIQGLAEKHDLKIVEDIAEAMGSKFKDQKVGKFGDAAATSFYANKLITTGEGGMVITSSEEVVSKARQYRNLYFNPTERFLHDGIGYNFRMTNLQASVGVAQLERIEYFIELKKKFGKMYQDRLSEIKGLRFQTSKENVDMTYWMYCIELNPEETKFEASDIMKGLREYKIGTRPFFMGLHRQQPLKDLGLFIGEENNYPNADYAFKYGLYLPSGLTLNEEKIDFVCGKLKEIMN